MLKKAKISSVGMYVPERIMTNAEFEKTLDTTDEWITTRTGIKQRRIVSGDGPSTTAELGFRAAKMALERADCTPDNVDAIVCATFTPDAFMPSTACAIQNLLGCKKAFAFDVGAACAGFVYALNVANSLVATGQCHKVIVIGAEVISKALDWTDRGTCILFGDGAGAVLVEESDDPNVGIGETYLRSDGTQGDILYQKVYGDDRYLHMKGGEVFKYAVNMMTEASLAVLKQSNMTGDDIDWLIPHQANSRILFSVANQLSMAREKVVMNLERYGNTSSATIPLALNEVWEEGKIKPGTTVLFTALGGGLTAGSIIVKF
jgi:3-oxoacyl-[acyl-carrier-protein] synthase III